MKWTCLTIAALFVFSSAHTQSAPGSGHVAAEGYAGMYDTDSSHQQQGYLNSVAVGAVRDLIKRFDEPAKVHWSIMESGYVATFSLAGMSLQVAYTKRGNWLYTIRTYGEKKMPHDIRHLVKSTYYDYSITQVAEINQVNLQSTIYVIHLEDEWSYKMIRVADGEMDEMQTFYKIKK
jgi:hypothetical protein